MRRQILIILGAGMVMLFGAERVEAQVYESSAMNALSIHNLRGTRGSDRLSFFNRYSTGSDSFRQTINRTQRDPLAYNNQVSMSVVSPVTGARRAGLTPMSTFQGVSNQRSTYLGRTGVGAVGGPPAVVQPTNIALGRTGSVTGRSITSGRRFFGGGGFRGGGGMTAGTGMGTRTAFSSNRSLRNSQQMMNRPRVFSASVTPVSVSGSHTLTGLSGQRRSLSSRSVLGETRITTGQINRIADRLRAPGPELRFQSTQRSMFSTMKSQIYNQVARY